MKFRDKKRESGCEGVQGGGHELFNRYRYRISVLHEES